MEVQKSYGDEILVTEEPEILSERDREYFEKYSSKIIVGYVDPLCEVLMNPSEKIFTPENNARINQYNVEIDGKEYPLGVLGADILLLIRDGDYDKNEVLHDTAMLASVEISKKAIEFLDKAGYLKILNRTKIVG